MDLIEREGYDLQHTLCDDGVSAWKDGVVRPDYNALVSLVEADQLDVVVADAPDRITRLGTFAYLTFINTCHQHGVNIHTVSQGFVDTSTREALLMGVLEGDRSERESSDKSRRLKNYIAERAADGLPRMAGPRPFGWQADKLTLDQDESALLLAAVEHVLAGKSINAIVRAWNDAGIPTTRGKRWTKSGVKAVLVRERMAGLVRLNGQVQEGVVGRWEPLIDRKTHESLIAILAPGGGARAVPRHLLSGLMRCSCGLTMRAATGGRREQVYRCAIHVDPSLPRTAERHSSISRLAADQRVLRELAGALMLTPQAELPHAAESAELGTYYARMVESQEAISRLVDAVASGALRGSDVASRRAQIDADILSTQARIRELTARNAQAGLIADVTHGLFAGSKADIGAAVEVKRQILDRVEGLDVEDQRALVAWMFRIVVHPGRGTDRMDIRWLVGDTGEDLVGSAMTPQ